ncbi:MAG: RNA ligase family protein [Eubacteriales bacterium]
MIDFNLGRPVKPMLISISADPFNDPDYIYELKLDGERCVAYLNRNDIELYNKRGNKLLIKVPELGNINRQIKKRCILDGELIVTIDGKPNFYEIVRRLITSNKLRIELLSGKYPASYVVYDILYIGDKDITGRSLLERKDILNKNLIENEKIALSRFLPEKGIEFFDLANQNGLEGIVAKKADSIYYPGTRTKEWIKIKNLLDDDFIICGYILKADYVVSLVIGQFNTKKELLYKGHVTLGISKEDFSIIAKHEKIAKPYFKTYPKGGKNSEAVWIKPTLVCTVSYMVKTRSSIRHPVYKGLRLDKTADECIDKG